MADVARYQDPATGHLFTMTAADAAKFGYVRYGTPDKMLPAEAETAEAEAEAEAESQDESDYPQHIGGGVYQLSSGDRVRGKAEAADAEAALHAESAE